MALHCRLNPPSNDITFSANTGSYPKPEEPTNPSPPPSPTLRDKLAKLTPSQLAEAADDAFDDETEQIIRQYHKERLNQLRKLEHARFGRVYPISREDYTREVTEASNVDAPDAEGKWKGTGVRVVCFLYKDGYACFLIPVSHHFTTKFYTVCNLARREAT